MTFGYVASPFGALWHHIVVLLDRAVARSDDSWNDVAAALGDSTAQLWLTLSPEPVAAMVTRLDGDTLEVWLAGGAVLAGSVPYLELAIDASKAMGTTSGRITGRKGWARVLRGYGWRVAGDDLVKEWAVGQK